MWIKPSHHPPVPKLDERWDIWEIKKKTLKKNQTHPPVPKPGERWENWEIVDKKKSKPPTTHPHASKPNERWENLEIVKKNTVEKNQTLPPFTLTKTKWKVSKLNFFPKHTVEKNTHHPHQNQNQIKGEEIRKILKREKNPQFSQHGSGFKKAGLLDHFYRNLF